ncbi:MAG: phospholipase D family protein [Dokdonella sp.]|uniref:phospholipase D family protein n=1 Tax=Dokdonella sp. TaxID=2291710 RepID=UPI003F7FF2B1
MRRPSIRNGLTVVFALCLGACATLRTDAPKPVTTSLPPVADSASTRYVAGEVAAHPGQSGFRPLLGNANALMSRVVLADAARHSIDLQYYIFRNDATGRLVAQRLLAAADRGVRVRILLDDIDISKEDHLLDALHAHPNIEVRLFNPFRFRHRSILAKAGQFLLEGPRLNRRMHNKSFIVDGMQAIVGGRNIGDAYFDAGDEVHFRDLDVLAIGPVVAQVAAMFDRYWNSDAAFPVTAYSDNDVSNANLAVLRDRLLRDARAFTESEYAEVVAEDLPNGPSAERKGAWFWGEAYLAADDPAKVDPSPGVDERRLRRIAPALRRELDAAQSQALIVSPYFIPGADGVALLAALVARGATVKVLTNALSATDEPEVHAGYAKYREDLLRAGVELYELEGLRGAGIQRAYGTSSGVSLHAKTMVIDHRRVFVGSMNFDPRSVAFNTEMGVIVDSPGLADAIEQFFAHATAPDNAYHVELVDGRLHWTGKDDGKVVEYDHDPGASRWQRAKLRVLRLLPIEGLL